jgi:hemoglobin-like flavoprotein
MGIASSVVSSSTSSVSYSNLNDLEILLMPTYFISTSITIRDLQVCQTSWNQILSNQSREFIKQCQINPDFSLKYHKNCCQWFTDLFYERLFDIHPLARPLFASVHMEKLQQHLIKIISLTLTQNKNQLKFKKLMKDLTKIHCQLGIRAIEHGVIGSVLFHTLEKCLGTDQYPAFLDQAWKGIFSSMLKEIIPECVRFELTQHQSQYDLNQQQRQNEQQQHQQQLQSNSARKSFLEQTIESVSPHHERYLCHEAPPTPSWGDER